MWKMALASIKKLSHKIRSATEANEGAASSIMVIIIVINNAVILTVQKSPGVIGGFTCALNHETNPADSSMKCPMKIRGAKINIIPSPLGISHASTVIVNLRITRSVSSIENGCPPHPGFNTVSQKGYSFSPGPRSSSGHDQNKFLFRRKG